MSDNLFDSLASLGVIVFGSIISYITYKLMIKKG